MSIEVEFEFDNEDSATLQELLRAEGATNIEEVAEEGLLPLIGIVVAAAIAVTALANVVIRLSRLWACGIIIDARSATVHTQKNCDLPRGSVIVLSSDGTQQQLYEPSQLDLANAMQGVLGEGAG